MSRGQRLTFLAIAAAIAVIALIVISASGGDDETGSTAQQTVPALTATPEPGTTPEATPTETPEPTPEPVPVLRAGEVAELEFEQGETVEFRVRSDSPDHVHVHGYDLFKDVAPGKPVAFSFEATITGIFEIELEEQGTLLAELKVTP